MSIATRTGDDGTTSLLYGRRVPKNHPQIEAIGACDELSAAIGAIKPLLDSNARGERLRELLGAVQLNLVALMGEVACAESDAARHAASKFERISGDDIQRLDAAIAALEESGLKFSGWATPGANSVAAALDLARSTARRAERRLVALPPQLRSLRPELLQFMNRLSDLLWLLAREAES